MRPLDSFSLDAFSNGKVVAANVIEHLDGKITADELRTVFSREHVALPIIERGSCTKLK